MTPRLGLPLEPHQTAMYTETQCPTGACGVTTRVPSAVKLQVLQDPIGIPATLEEHELRDG